MSLNTKSQAVAAGLFSPSRRAATMIAGLGLAALGTALWLRYGVVQNTEIGIACEAGEQSLICKLRLAVILMFMQGLFGWAALIAAGFQLWRPNVAAFAIGVTFALFGLILYNTRIAGLAVPLLLLSLARPSR